MNTHLTELPAFNKLFIFFRFPLAIFRMKANDWLLLRFGLVFLVTF